MSSHRASTVFSFAELRQRVNAHPLFLRDFAVRFGIALALISEEEPFYQQDRRITNAFRCECFLRRNSAA
jgi:hypothetical protein